MATRLSVLALLLCAAATTAAATQAPAFPAAEAIFARGYLSDAEFVISDATTPPVDADWQPVKLPHLWGRSGLNARHGWYRIELPPAADPGPRALYLWRFSMNAAVWLNGEFLGDGGRFEEPIARNWNRPFLFLLPDSALREGPDHLYIRLATYSAWGNLPPVVVGPWDALRERYEERFFWQITMSQATFYVSIITAFAAFALWLVDRSWTLFAWLGASALAWSVYSINLYVQEIPISAEHWWVLVHSSIEWYGVTLACFAHRLVGLRLPRFEGLLLAWGVAATAWYALIPLEVLARSNSMLHAVTLLLAAYLAVLAFVRAWRQRALHLAAFAVCASVIVAFGLHDLSMNTMLAAELWIDQFFFLQFSAPILMLTMMGILAYRFFGNLRAVAASQARLRAERERIFADVHDDVGSKVLSLVYTAESPEQADLAREALRDIRAIIAGGTRAGGPLRSVLDPCQAEARTRCQRAGIAFEWTGEIAAHIEVDDSFQYHLQRILRELVSNAIKHSGTSRLEVLAEASDRALTLIVRDYGVGLADTDAGTGMAGIRRRASMLGGTVSWRTLDPGCAVELGLPIEGAST